MTQLISLTSAQVTMTSREIADLVESRHDKVKKSIERLAERGAIDLPHWGNTSIPWDAQPRSTGSGSETATSSLLNSLLNSLRVL